jgi:quercetin dioxygenase-like cupin family protein
MDMLEKVFQMTRTNEKTIEKVIQDENVHYMHMVLPENEGMPIHRTNANVYMAVIRGRLTIGLEDNAANQYESGTILIIPEGTMMNARNTEKEVLELTVVKAPAPKM